MIDVEELLSGKVKLQFGNAEQMAAIDKYQQAQEEAEEGLQMYRITLHYSGFQAIDVQAHDEEEAKLLANDIEGWDDIEWEGVEHTEVELMKEKDD